MVSEKIVIIDDDVSFANNLGAALQEYDVITFNDSQQAMEFFKNPNEISLAIIDVRMPEMDGIQLLQAIKENVSIPIIMVTGYGSKDLAIKALRNHADDFLEKPLDIETLRQRIRDLLQDRSGYAYQGGKTSHVDRIKTFVERNYKNASLAFIAEEMCLSPKYVSRMFNEKSGLGFRDYKVGVKIDKAKELLEKSSLNINQISMELGYQNPESFMRIFKKVTETTPKQYRKKYRSQKANASF